MRYLKNNLYTIFNSLAGLASIIGLAILALSDQTNAIIALSFLCFSLATLLICIIYALHSFIKKENGNNHLKVSVFTKFETLDKTHSVFETYRVIQSKSLVLSEIEQKFKWSGSRLPIVSSKFQTVKDVITEKQDYDKAILSFKKPLLYNETGVVHFKAETDDYDGTAKPHLDYRVESPINIIHYRVILKHKDSDFNTPAEILRKPIHSKHPVDYEKIGTIAYDERAKSYEYYLTDPEVGYFYRLQWEK